MAMEHPQAAAYPIQLAVDYPQRPLDRLSTFFRLVISVPILVVIAFLSGQTTDAATTLFFAGGTLFVAPLLLILFRGKYPRWWFDWNVALVKFTNRVTAYLLLLRDEYPSTDEEQAVHIEIPYPDVATDLSRWMPLVKWLLAIPHYVVLLLLGIGALIAVVIAWFAILFTGRYPTALFGYVVGVLRWGLRVESYAILLVTDQYPPFRLDP